MRRRADPAAGALEEEIPRLRRFARLLTRGDASRADDLVQETLLRALRSLESYREDAGLGTWMTSIMLNLHRSEHRQEVRRRAQLSAHFDGEAVALPRARSADGADETVIPEPSEPARQEQRLEVAQTLEALGGLPEDQRVPIALVAVGQMSYADAARTLGIKLGTLMSRISRGRAAMRARLEGPPPTGESETWTRTARRA
ncbi:MAG: sigma-70 family RNA polymerase sigma factor [Pseudomonadota bacterium]